MNTLLDTVTQATIEAMYFTDTGEPDQPSDLAPISPELGATVRNLCTSFIELVETRGLSLDGLDHHSLGHDLWFTTQGHGVGFWDGDWPEIGAELTDICSALPALEVYEGDDGNLYA